MFQINPVYYYAMQLLIALKCTVSWSGAVMTLLIKLGWKLRNYLSVCLSIFPYFCRKCQKTIVCTYDCSSVKFVLIPHIKKKKSKKVLKTTIFCRKHTNSYPFSLRNGSVCGQQASTIFLPKRLIRYHRHGRLSYTTI